MALKIDSILREALARRESLLRSLSVFRIFDGARDGEGGLFIDKLGPVLLIHYLVGGRESAFPFEEYFARPIDEITRSFQIETIYLRLHHSRAVKSAEQGAKHLFGPQCLEHIVEESGIKLIVRPEENVNAGLFVDMRDVRRLLKERSSKLRVLNLFCFTGSLGIASYIGGADEVVQVDVSKRMLTWGNENFELNKSGGSGEMRFIPEDARDFIKKEERRIEKGARPFDLIIVDPPSFGAGGKGAFSLKRDLEELLFAVCNVLGPTGSVIATTNSREFTPKRMEEIVKRSALRAARSVTETEALLPPCEDFLSRGEESISMRGVWVKTLT